MQVIENRRELRDLVSEWRREGERVALVPTMGNLHEGHLSLVRAAGRHAVRVVTSIFVNPAQFSEGEDFDRYPRTLEQDLAKLENEGCDLAFVPDADQLYPFGLDRAVMVRAAPDLAGRLEGRFRPGHFDGVVTVVARLFALVQPDVAVFGEKDYQQLLVVRRMAEDLGFDARVIGEKTVRSKAGLALSSRNAYLDEAQRQAANALNRALIRAARSAAADGAVYSSLEDEATDALEAVGLRVEYVAIRRSQDLAAPKEGDRDLRILAAAWCGRTRLIDNMAVDRASGP